MNNFFELRFSQTYATLIVIGYIIPLLLSMIYLTWQLSLLVIVILSIGAWFLWRTLFDNPIIAVRLNEQNFVVYYQNGQQQSQAYQALYFQSRYLVILPIACYAIWQKQSSLVIFADSLKNSNDVKMTDINRLLTIYQ